MSYAANLRREFEDSTSEQSLLVSGTCHCLGKAAKIERWRLEQIELPIAFFADPNLGSALRDLLRDAESLFYSLREIARDMYAAIHPNPKNEDVKARVSELIDAGPAAPAFFAEAERTLPRVLRLFAETRDDPARELWQAMLLRAAEKTWDALRQGLGSSPRALRAEAEAYPRFRGMLRKQGLLPEQKPEALTA